MAIAGYETGGLQPETSALRNVLAFEGICEPYTRNPYREEFLLGVGGGCGGGYDVLRLPGEPARLRLFGCWAPDGSPAFLRTIRRRLTLVTEENTTHDGAEAFAYLRRALDAGLPTIVAADCASLPWQGLPPALIGRYVTCPAVIGLDEGNDCVEVDQVGAEPWSVTLGQLQAARGEVPGDRHWSLLVSPESTAPDLPGAVRAGIEDCWQAARDHRPRRGLAAFAELAGTMTGVGPGSWQEAFPAGRALFQALAAIYRAIITDGGDHSFLRGMQAEFLGDAGAMLGEGRLLDAAARYREAAEGWNDLANAALPSEIPAFNQARQNLDRWGGHLRSGMLGAIEGIAEEQRQLAEIANGVEVEFPLSALEIRELLGDLASRLHALVALERQALDEAHAAIHESGVQGH